MCPPPAHGSIKPVLYHFRGFTNLIEAGFLLLNKTACVGYFALVAYRLFLFLIGRSRFALCGLLWYRRVTACSDYTLCNPASYQQGKPKLYAVSLVPVTY